MKVQIHLRAENLENIARGRWRGKKSNPYAKVLSVDGPDTSSIIELGRTEAIEADLSPSWWTTVTINHDEDENWTPLRVSILDSRDPKKHNEQIMKNNSSNVSNDRSLAAFFGSSEDPEMNDVNIEVGDILNCEGKEKCLELDDGGSLYVHIHECNEGEDTGIFCCHIRALDLRNIESGLLGLGAVDPYFEISKKFNDPTNGITRHYTVYRSEHIENTINPYWKPFEIDLERLCNNNLQHEIKIAIWDHQDRCADRLLGWCELTVDELKRSVSMGGNANRMNALSMENEEGEVMGLLVVVRAEIIPE